MQLNFTHNSISNTTNNKAHTGSIIDSRSHTHTHVLTHTHTHTHTSPTDNHFDHADRSFHSLQTAWHLASSVSTTDVKELIPELFFLPEFFTNPEGNAYG